jgi:hypothetical protein
VDVFETSLQKPPISLPRVSIGRPTERGVADSGDTRNAREGVPEGGTADRFTALLAAASLPDIGERIDRALDAIESDNLEQLRGVLPRIYARAPIQPAKLGELSGRSRESASATTTSGSRPSPPRGCARPEARARRSASFIAGSVTGTSD